MKGKRKCRKKDGSNTRGEKKGKGRKENKIE